MEQEQLVGVLVKLLTLTETKTKHLIKRLI